LVEAVITGAVAAITSRKWLVELILLAVVIAGVWWFCHHLVDVGVQRQKDADAAELVKLQRDADVESGRLRGMADAAQAAQEKEHADNLDYRRTHPLHGGLCLNKGGGDLPEAAGLISSDGTISTATADLLAVPAGDPRAGGQPEADVRHLLDVLAGRADLVSGTLREFQAR
jgi:hypothetical protein